MLPPNLRGAPPLNPAGASADRGVQHDLRCSVRGVSAARRKPCFRPTPLLTPLSSPAASLSFSPFRPPRPHLLSPPCASPPRPAPSCRRPRGRQRDPVGPTSLLHHRHRHALGAGRGHRLLPPALRHRHSVHARLGLSSGTRVGSPWVRQAAKRTSARAWRRGCACARRWAKAGGPALVTRTPEPYLGPTRKH